MFDRTQTSSGEWRVTANPLAFSNKQAEIVVLGFSKGPTQAGALASAHHDAIAYKGSRRNVGKILAHVGLIRANAPDLLAQTVDKLIADRNGRFHFGSLIRCTVERFDSNKNTWSGSGGGMLDRFVKDSFGRGVAGRCASRFLSDLPDQTKLIIMFGLGTKGNYVLASRRLLETARPGRWQTLNEVAYRDEQVTVVHVEHFASQGALIPNWLGENNHIRARLGLLAREAVCEAFRSR